MAINEITGNKFSEVKDSVVTTVLSGAVPFVRGLHGIGKSEMMESVAEQIGEILNKDVIFHQVDMAHIKEGELTGMPVTARDPETGCMINTYTVYSLFNDVIKTGERNADIRKAKEVITKLKAKKSLTEKEKERLEYFESIKDETETIPVIFFDEINRADRVVFNELMPIILNKRVQETYLPEETIILAAGNPEDISGYKGATDDYSVLPMDPALKDRFFIYELKVDPVEWLSWAISSKKIHEDIIAYITDRPNDLHFLSNDELNPTPRGWTMFSKAYSIVMDKYKGNYDAAEDEVIMLGSAKIGKGTVCNFSRFLRENKNPLLKVKDFFAEDINEEKFQSNLSKLSTDQPTRQYVTMKGITDWVIEKIDPSKSGLSDAQKKQKEVSKKEKEDIIAKYCELLWVLPKDIMIGTLKEVSTISNKVLTMITTHDSKKVIEVIKYLH